MKAKDLRNGMLIRCSGKILQVISFEYIEDHVQAVTVNLKTDIRETISFHQEDVIKNVVIEKRELQYSNREDEIYCFLDTQTYDLVETTKEMLARGFCYVKESDVCNGAYVENELVLIYPPIRVCLKILSTSIGQDSSTKFAKLENGYIMQVPSHYSEGDILVIDTATGSVLGRG